MQKTDPDPACLKFSKKTGWFQVVKQLFKISVSLTKITGFFILYSNLRHYPDSYKNRDPNRPNTGFFSFTSTFNENMLADRRHPSFERNSSDSNPVKKFRIR